MKLTKSQYNLLADVSKESCTVVFGALVVSGVFSSEPIRWQTALVGFIIYVSGLFIALVFKKKGDSND